MPRGDFGKGRAVLGSRCLGGVLKAVCLEPDLGQALAETVCSPHRSP